MGGLIRILPPMGGTKVDLRGLFRLPETGRTPCRGLSCPLCAAGHKPKPLLLVTEKRTGKQFMLSPRVQELIEDALARTPRVTDG